MNRLRMIACSLLVIVTADLIAYSVFAQAEKAGVNSAEAGKKVAAQLDQNKMTLAKAVTVAEEHSKGRAISAMSQINEHDQMALHVWCVVGDTANAPKIFKCYVDLSTGKVAGMKDVHEFPTPAHEHDAEHAPGHAPSGSATGHGSAAKVITDKTVDAACGACIYKMPGVTGCPLAVKIDGTAYLVEGALWPNHDYCDRNCQAIVSGRIEGDPPKFIATKLEVKP
jgi:hypothetical protein